MKDNVLFLLAHNSSEIAKKIETFDLVLVTIRKMRVLTGVDRSFSDSKAFSYLFQSLNIVIPHVLLHCARYTTFVYDSKQTTSIHAIPTQMYRKFKSFGIKQYVCFDNHRSVLEKILAQITKQ